MIFSQFPFFLVYEKVLYPVEQMNIVHCLFSSQRVLHFSLHSGIILPSYESKSMSLIDCTLAFITNHSIRYVCHKEPASCCFHIYHYSYSFYLRQLINESCIFFVDVNSLFQKVIHLQLLVMVSHFNLKRENLSKEQFLQTGISNNSPCSNS